jgi:RNA polymerase sigma-70 factor (ECF subfamily)
MSFTLEQEKEMVLALQQGDRKAAAWLYETFSDVLFRKVILSRLPYIEQAEDVLCETFRIAFEKITTYTVLDRSIFFWLRRIAINLIVDTYRKQVRKRELAERILARDAVDMVMGSKSTTADDVLSRTEEEEDTKTMVHKALERLNPRYAKALRMRLLEDQSREACAEEFGISVGNFDVLFHRASKAFRDNYPP